MLKKSRERALLQTVYDMSAYGQVLESEAPDFQLKRPGSPWSFGVEITEFFYSGSEARLDSIPDYFTKLLVGDPPRHREDIDGLAVSDVEILEPDGTSKGKSKAIIPGPR
jgi:hypothetical protein